MVTCIALERRTNLVLPKQDWNSDYVEQEKPKHDNQAILKDLERQRDLLTIGAYAAGIGSLAGVTFFTPLIPAFMPSLTILMGKLQRISQQVLLMQRLIETFEEEGVLIFPRIDTPNSKQIDFFLRFADKKLILLKIASQGDSAVSFNESTEKLQYRKKGGGLKNWEPDPLLALNLQSIWLGKEGKELKGGSSKDTRRPVAKFLILWGATKLGDHNEHLYSTMAGYQALWIKKFGSTCIVQEDQAIEAIKAHLVKQREQ